ncbi:Hypothetical predicted protein, partial [Scomber scombrus]
PCSPIKKEEKRDLKLSITRNDSGGVSLDLFQKETLEGIRLVDEDKQPDTRAVLVNTQDDSWRASSLRDGRGRLENHSLIVKLNQELTERIMEVKELERGDVD